MSDHLDLAPAEYLFGLSPSVEGIKETMFRRGIIVLEHATDATMKRMARMDTEEQKAPFRDLLHFLHNQHSDIDGLNGAIMRCWGVDGGAGQKFPETVWRDGLFIACRTVYHNRGFLFCNDENGRIIHLHEYTNYFFMFALSLPHNMKTFTAGRAVVRGGRKGNEQAHGTKDEKARTQQEYHDAWQDLRRGGMGKVDAYEAVAREKGVSGKTVQRAVQKISDLGSDF